MDELLAKLSKETYLDGVTFSGGDPFQQADKFAYMAKKIHEMGMNI
ncbi:MAG: radical SAM protein [Mycoplasmoidaceae bacterium]|nr:radical SAM protein [Mycoplasmoidaceae bacterium]